MNKKIKIVSVLTAVGLTLNSTMLGAFAETDDTATLGASEEEETRVLIAETYVTEDGKQNRVSINLPSARDGYYPDELYATDTRNPDYFYGDYSEYEALCASHPIDRVETKWTELSGADITKRFVKNTVYKATVTVTAKEGFYFSEKSIPNVRAVTDRGLDVPDSNMSVSEDGTTLTIFYYSKAAQGYNVNDSDSSVVDTTKYFELYDEIYVDGETFDEHSTPVNSRYSDFEGFGVSDYTVTGFSNEENKVYEAGKEYTISVTLDNPTTEYDLTSIKFVSDVALSHYDISTEGTTHYFYENTYLGSQNVTTEVIDADTIKLTYKVTPVEKVDMSPIALDVFFIEPVSSEIGGGTCDLRFYLAGSDENAYSWMRENGVDYRWNGNDDFADKAGWDMNCYFAKNAYFDEFKITDIYKYKCEYNSETGDWTYTDEKDIISDASCVITPMEDFVNGYNISVSGNFQGLYNANELEIWIDGYWNPALGNRYFYITARDYEDYYWGNFDYLDRMTTNEAVIWYINEIGYYDDRCMENLIHNKSLEFTFDLSDMGFDFSSSTKIRMEDELAKYLTGATIDYSTKTLTFTYAPWCNYAQFDSATSDITATEPSYREDTYVNDDDVAIEEEEDGWISDGDIEGDVEDDAEVEEETEPSVPVIPSYPTYIPTPVVPSTPADDSTDKENVIYEEETATALEEATEEEIIEAIDKLAESGENKTLVLEQGEATVLDEDIIKAVKGKDIDVEIPLTSEDGTEYTWKINGQSVEEDFDISSINLNVDFGTNNIPIDERITRRALGNRADRAEIMQISLTHDGEFGFEGELTFNMGKQAAGRHVYLYHYNEKNNTIELAYTAQVDKDGNVSLKFSHASEYLIATSEEELYVQTEVSMDEEEEEETDVEAETEEIEDETEDEEIFEEEDDGNPSTGVVLVFSSVIISAAAALLTRKRNNK